jgi:hypothetical protein
VRTLNRKENIGDKTMGIAQQTRFETTQREVRNHDAMILAGYSVFAILLIIGLYLGSMSPGTAPGDFASMIVFP